jgi:hypothetical protein
MAWLGKSNYLLNPCVRLLRVLAFAEANHGDGHEDFTISAAFAHDWTVNLDYADALCKHTMASFSKT